MKQFPLSNIEQIQFLIVPKIKPSCGPIFFTTSLEKASGNVSANGSFGLIDTGQRRLLITCWHVVEEFRQRLLREADLKMCVCLDRKNPVVFTINYLIDEDKSADLATFDMSSLLPACGGRSFYRLTCDHIHSVKRNDRLVFVGYPGYLRKETDDGIYFGTTPHVVIAHDLSPFGIISDVSRVMNVERVLLSHQNENALGGVSGSPCFLMENYTFLHLVGFVTGELRSQKLLQIASAKFLNADGTIKRR